MKRYFFFGRDALSQVLHRINITEITTQSNHRRPSVSVPVDSRILEVTQTPVPYITAVNSNPSTPARRTNPTNALICFSSSSASGGIVGRRVLTDGGGRKSSDLLSRSSLRIDGSHNLMNTLSTQIKNIGNMTKGLTFSSQFNNRFIPINVSRRPWTKRAPNPFFYEREFMSSFFRKLIFAISLSGVASPSSQGNFRFFEFLNMCRRNFSVTFALGELLERTDVGVETCCVVHSRDINTSMSLLVRAS
jgi:hypothetical protein